MSLQKSITITKDMEFEKCGEIMVAAKHNIFALSCKYCRQKFTQFQGFMKHLQLQHSDRIKFGEKQKNVETYAVEELLTTLNQSSMPVEEEGDEDEGGDNQSEESGMVDDEGNWLSEEDKKWLEEADTDSDRGDNKKDEKKKVKSLVANMSILKALEDCDVSFNNMDNLDVTKCEEENKNSDHEMEDDEEDDDLNKTLLQQIQDDWCSSEEEESPNKSKVSNNQDEKLRGEEKNLNKSKSSNNQDKERNDTQTEENFHTKSASLKSLLEGLEDLDDVDSLLENLEDNMVVEQKENKKTILLNTSIENKNCESFVKPTNKCIKKSETPVLEDLDLTLNHQSLEKETIGSYNLAVKDKKSSDNGKCSKKSSEKKQQKMILNINTGEFESVDTEDSSEEEELLNKSNKTSQGVKDKKDIENSSKKKEQNTILNINTGEFESVDTEDSSQEEELLNKSHKTSQGVKDKKYIENSSKKKEQKMILNMKTGEFDTEDSSEESIKTSQDNDDNSIMDETFANNTFMAQLESQLNAQLESDENSLIDDNDKTNIEKSYKTKQQNDFDLQLQNLEMSLEVDNEIDNYKSYESLEMSLEVDNEIANYKSDESLDEDTLIYNKFINKSGKSEESKDLKKMSKENKKINLNDDLTKALEDALGEDDLNMLNMFDEDENEPPLNQNLKDLLALELMEEEDEIVTEEKSKDNTINSKMEESIAKDKIENSTRSPELDKMENIKINSKNSNKFIEGNTKDKKDQLKETSKMPPSRYQKTNMKSRQRQELKYPITKNKVVLKSIKTTNSDNISNSLKTEQSSQNSQNMILKNHKTIKPKTPTKSNDNQENSLKNQRKNPLKENRENIFSNLRKTPKKEKQETITPDLIKKIKQEKFTPFINTERGDRTPLQNDDIFLKQSPKSQAKLDDFFKNITPNQGAKISPNTKERKFLKQSPKTQERNEQQIEQLHHKTPTTRGDKTPITRKHIVMKKTPETQEKNEEQTNSKLGKTPRITPGKKTFSLEISPSPLSPDKNSKDSEIIKKCTTTPQKIRNVAVKLNISKSPSQISPLKKQKMDNFCKTTKPETSTNFGNNLKLPKGITLTKMSPCKIPKTSHNQSVLDETPIKPIYCKQNFSESSLVEVRPAKENINKVTTLIQPQKRSNNSLPKLPASKLRERKASIDIVNKSNDIFFTTNKTAKLDYKSYSVNRSARKMEILQKMRHIKTDISKSLENDEQVTDMTNRKLTFNGQKKKPIKIKNIQILPKLKEDQMTPLLNASNYFKKSVNPEISPKNLNDDEKHAKKALHCGTTPFNDDEKLRQKSLKRRANSPILCEELPAKRLHTSPLVCATDVETKSRQDLEKTKLGLSGTVADNLQRDLKANRLNVDSLPSEELPKDDNSPNESSKETNGKETKSKDSEIDNNCNNNILDDLLEQVDVEQKSGVNNYPTEKDPEATYATTTRAMFIDFDENKDLNLLNNFGLKMIKSPNIENILSLEEEQENFKKAQKFAEIYKTWQRIWSSKNSENPNLRQELDISFKQFLTEINQIHNLELNMIDIKRLVNLISIWYCHNYSKKLIEKKLISDTTIRYLLIFNYIPKTAKRFYYCEFCEEYFNTANRYVTHRILHTGASYPYQCSKCSDGFTYEKKCRAHEKQCRLQRRSNNSNVRMVLSEDPKNNSTKNNVEEVMNHILKSNNIRITKFGNKPNGTVQGNTTKSDDKSLNKSPENQTADTVNRFKCHVCVLDFETSKELNDHSKTHIKTVYSCAKCQLKFSSVPEVRTHMATCNRNIKKLIKQITPKSTQIKSGN